MIELYPFTDDGKALISTLEQVFMTYKKCAQPLHQSFLLTRVFSDLRFYLLIFLYRIFEKAEWFVVSECTEKNKLRSNSRAGHPPH